MSAPPVIAIVDDDASVRQAMGQLLRSCDLAVALFGSGAELLQAAALDRLDCVITDVQMPGMNGFALCEALRARGLDMPVVFMTGFAHEGYEQRARAIRAAGFLNKPFQDHEVMRCIESALSARGHGGAGGGRAQPSA